MLQDVNLLSVEVYKCRMFVRSWIYFRFAA